MDQQPAQLIKCEGGNWTVVAALPNKRSVKPEFKNTSMFVVADVNDSALTARPITSVDSSVSMVCHSWPVVSKIKIFTAEAARASTTTRSPSGDCATATSLGDAPLRVPAALFQNSGPRGPTRQTSAPADHRHQQHRCCPRHHSPATRAYRSFPVHQRVNHLTISCGQISTS